MKGKRRRHDPEFKARVALEAIKGVKTIREHRWLCVLVTSGEAPADTGIVGRLIPIDGNSFLRVTTIGKNPKPDGWVESYRIHADVHCICKQWLSLERRGWGMVYLVSSRAIHDALRAEACLPEGTVTEMDARLLLP
jgi:hypothetical protein